MAAFGFSLDLKGVGVLLCLGKGQDDPKTLIAALVIFLNHVERYLFSN